MASETDQIRIQIAETRNHLKLHMASLEDQVMGTVNSTKDTVTDTIDTIKSGIRRVSPVYQFNEHPLVFAAGAVIAGLAAGRMIGNALEPRTTQPSTDNSLAPVSPEWKALKGIAAGAFMQVAGEIAKSVFPKHENVVHQIVQDFRSKLETGHE